VDLTRLRSVRVGDVVATSQPALLVGYPKILEALSEETGRNIELILGAPFLERMASVIDYDAETWSVWPYTQTDHVDPDLFLLPGFSFCKAAAQGTGAKVVAVYNFTTAQTAGIMAGDHLVEVDGIDLRNADAATIGAALRAGGEGAVMDMTFETADGATVTHPIELERILEEFAE
jgi:membrane-associated protease RseP (regulator of RpoE activity)